MKKGGRQAGTVILFAEHVMRKYLMKFAHIVFVVFAMLPQKNIVNVKETTDFLIVENEVPTMQSPFY